MNTESNRMRLIIADSLPAKELMTFGIYILVYIYIYIYIYIYFKVLHKSYVKLQPGHILYNVPSCLCSSKLSVIEAEFSLVKMKCNKFVFQRICDQQTNKMNDIIFLLICALLSGNSECETKRITEKGLIFEVKLSLLGMDLCMCYKIKRKYPWTHQEGI
jgi:hypothetical protein